MKDIDSISLEILNRAYEKGQLGHALLLYGDSLCTLESTAELLATKLLKQQNLSQAADYYPIRPANKMRQISVEPIRNLIHSLQQTPLQTERKVAVIIEADRLHPSAANAFLKTLEEPSRDTTLILLSTRLHAVLPTLRSRCQHYRFQQKTSTQYSETWQKWLKDYDTWLLKAAQRPQSSQDITERVMGIYRLTYLFEQELTRKTDALEASKNKDPHLSEEEKEAALIGQKKELRRLLLKSIAEATRYNAFTLPSSPDRIKAYIQAIELLEHNVQLLEVNLNEASALESFLLHLVRLWIV